MADRAQFVEFERDRTYLQRSALKNQQLLSHQRCEACLKEREEQNALTGDDNNDIIDINSRHSYNQAQNQSVASRASKGGKSAKKLNMSQVRYAQKKQKPKLIHTCVMAYIDDSQAGS